MKPSFALLFILCSGVAFAQAVAGLGAISGSVRDASGLAVPNAQVVVANPAKGIRRQLSTTEAGIFSAPSLVPAQGYTVTITKQGFADYQAKDVEVLVGQNVAIDTMLAVAGATTMVEVEAAAPVVESTKTDVSQVVNSNQITNLPINGRRVDSFVLLAPAVVPDGTFGLISFRGIAGGNAFLTDGNDTTNQFYNENAGRTRISTQISQDAVQEFQVLSNGFSAEFGHAMGGVINTVTRSGTNDIHGTAYWFFRNRTLNARDRYATVNPKEVRHQAGVSIGGPIRKDKLFYFVNTEITRRDFPLVNRLINPTFFNPAGDLIIPCGAPATPAQCEAAKAIFPRQFQVLDRTANSELGFAKLDWRPTDRNSFSASFNYLRWISPNGIQTQAVLTNGNGIGNNANSTVRTRYGRVAWTAIPSGTIVNEARFGWFKDRLFDDFNPDLIPPVTGRLGLTVQGQANLGVAIDYPRLNPSEQRFQYADNLSWTRGRHSMKFGIDVMNTEDYLNILRNQFGSYTYSTFSSFAADYSGQTNGKHWQTFGQTFGNPLLDFTTRDWAFFAQDQIRVSPKLTINGGLRYEYTQIPQPSQVNPDYPQTGRINAPTKNFAPRFGLAYSFNEKTILRAGYGLFYSRFQGSLLQTLFFTNGIYQPQVSLNGTVASDLAAGPAFPNILPLDTNLSQLPRGSVDLDFAAPNFRNPYTQQGNVAIERELTKNLGLTVNYIWSRGIGLYSVRDLNIGPLGPEVSYRINDAAGNQVGTYTTPTYRLASRVDQRYRRVMQIENGGQSWYNGLAVQLRKRLSHGLEGSLAYTWSHAIDTSNQGGGTNALFFDSLRSTFNGDWSRDKASSALDQRHRLMISSVWQPTFSKSSSAWVRYLVNNWQLSQITTIASTQPATAVIRVSGSPFTGAAFTGTLNGFGGSTRVPFWPLSSLDIDQIHRVDARLSKLLPFGERFRLYLNFEAFNVFNTVSNTFVFTEAYSATNGVLTPTPGLGQGNQSQGFPDGTNARRAQVSLRFMW